MDAVDLEDLARRATTAAQSWAPGCTIDSVSVLEGGTVSLVYTAEVHDGPPQHPRVVLKVAPAGLPPVRNRDVLRQGRCMAALSGQPGVSVPEVLFSDPGEPVAIQPFIATDFVAGECKEPLLEAATAPMDPVIVARRAMSAIEVLSSLHRLDPVDDLGLGDEAVTTLEGEVQRWTNALDVVPDEFRIGYERCAAALRASAPAMDDPVVVHGDYRLGNMLCDDTDVKAVIDWEIWSISDPRLDLSWMLFFTEEADHPVASGRTGSGMPSDRDLLAAYERARGTTVRDLEWFDALTRYKEAAAMALIAKHMRRRDPDSDRATAMGATCVTLIQQAARIVAT
jgi:aminoglycoside phosphotransferase (APT) family kinase protein